MTSMSSRLDAMGLSSESVDSAPEEEEWCSLFLFLYFLQPSPLLAHEGAAALVKSTSLAVSIDALRALNRERRM